MVEAPTVSFAWNVAPTGPSAGLLKHLITSLHGKEMGRLKIKERDILAPGRNPDRET